MSRSSGVVAAVLLTCLLAACHGPASVDETAANRAEETASTSPSDNPLYVPPSSYDFTQNPKLLERILDRPYGYFRFINTVFSQRVCEHFKDDLPSLPSVNLHGDAHLEQYAVTKAGRGLTDFDDASTGPPIIDLVRFGVSVLLAAEANGWGDHRAELAEAFMSGYRSALANPELTAPVPAVVERIRSEFDPDRAAFLSWADSLMEPPIVSDEVRQTSWSILEDRLSTMYPEVSSSAFQVKKSGPLSIGIGSALDEKYLLRLEGPSPADEDDLIVEAKEVRDLQGIDCIHRKVNDPYVILVNQSRLAYVPNRFLGYVHFTPRMAKVHRLGSDYWDGKTYWFFAWEDNYSELSVEDSFESPEDLAEVVYDCGVQLGRGHPIGIASPHDRQLRRALSEIKQLLGDDVRDLIIELTAQTIEAWERFVEEATR